MRHPTIFADLNLLFVAIIWGSTFVLVQNAIDQLPPFSFNGIRFLLAAVILLMWILLFYRDQLKSLTFRTLTHGMIIGTCLFLGYAFQTFGLLYTTSSKAGFITGLNVVLVPLFAFFFLKERPRRASILGTGLAMIGLYLLTLGDSFSINQGDLLVLLCAIAFGLHIVLTGKFAPDHPVLCLTFIQIATVSILNLIFASFTEPIGKVFTSHTLFKPTVAVALLITAVFATALAFFIQTHFQKQTTPTHVALIFATEPVFAALTGVIFNNETLGVKALFGCLFILLGMILSELPTETLRSFLKKTRRV